jgi:hypothetical protein
LQALRRQQSGGALMNNRDPRIEELLELAVTEGISLPYPPETIIRMEDAGNVVDLRTGAIEIGGEHVRYEPAQAEQRSWWQR